jgi:hypothetical protein
MKFKVRVVAAKTWWRRNFGVGLLLFASGWLSGCKSKTTQATPADVSVSLSAYGLPDSFLRESDSDNCNPTIIVYRFVAWINADRVAVGFSLNPACRAKSDQPVPGLLRILAFNAEGRLQARRDLPYEADAGEEIVAPGEGSDGPDGTLLVRIEEALHTKSGVLLLNAHLQDITRINRFMETRPLVGERPIAFQEGIVLSGPRTYDLFDGFPAAETDRVTEDWPSDALDRKFGSHGLAYFECLQELQPGKYQSSKVIYSGAHRRCALEWQSFDGKLTWSALLQPDEVGEVMGLLSDGSVAGIVRSPTANREQLRLWRENGTAQLLPWLPEGYETTLQSASSDMSRYEGYGTVRERPICSWLGFLCAREKRRLMVFDRRVGAVLMDRPIADTAQAAISPDGMHLATFEDGRLNLYRLPPQR